MSNFEKAEQLILGRTATAAAKALEEAGLLAPDVQIIRTLEELEALDPDTVLIDSDGEEVFAFRMQVSIGGLGSESMYYDSFPAAVVATGKQVRAAHEAMEQGNE